RLDRRNAQRALGGKVTRAVVDEDLGVLGAHEGDDEIEIAVVVHIAKGRTVARPDPIESDLGRDLDEGAIALVAPELVGKIDAGQEDIDPAVAVVVSDRRATPHDLEMPTRYLGEVGRGRPLS